MPPHANSQQSHHQTIGCLSRFIVLILTLGVLLLVQPLAQAQTPGVEPGETLQTNPKPREVAVTASVADLTPPSPPVLVSPSNGQLLTTNAITYVWQPSTDDQGIDHYQLWVDGALLFDSIPTTSTTTATYTLTVTGTQLSLSPSATVADGTHTWKIIAVDTSDLTNTSATWQFTVDTLAPVFLITQVDTIGVSISAQDASTIPTSPLTISTPDPTLSGTGESGSSGIARVSIPGESDQLISFSIASDGTWSIQLAYVPLDTVVSITFTITDLAGNVSVISDLQLLRPSQPLPTPTSVTTITPTLPPGVTPTPTTAPFLPPLPTIPPEIIPPPLLPVISQIEKVVQSPRELIAKIRPAAFSGTPTKVTISIVHPLHTLTSWLALLWMVLPFCLAFTWLLKKMTYPLTRASFGQAWWAVGFKRGRVAQGIVFLAPEVTTVAFTRVLLVGYTHAGRAVQIERLTDKTGAYPTMAIPDGEYRITVADENFLFPALFNAPEHSLSSTYYLGEELHVTPTQSETKLLLPVQATAQTNTRTRPPIWLVELAKWHGSGLLPHAVILLLIVLVYPSGANVLSGILYAITLGVSRVLQRKPKKQKNVYTLAKQALSTALIRIEQGESSEVGQTDADGRYLTQLQEGEAAVAAVLAESTQWQAQIKETTGQIGEQVIVLHTD